MKNYEINEDTYAILYNGKGKTKILEKDENYEIENTAYNIMDESCKYYGSSYIGRLVAAKEMLDFSYKVPILVEECSGLIFFPIKSSLSEDCSWINLNSIKKVQKNGKNSKIIFNNNEELELDVSKLSIENQIYRSILLESEISKRKNAKKRG